tara:strand:- start:5064 stop:6023 length:960 start_codon:yes stop_codon:yes gene_type:complete
MKFSLIVLAYNEEPTIEKVIEKYIHSFNNIIVVNDASKDQTKIILETLKKKYSNLSIVNNEKNLGAGKSFELGLELFLKNDDDFVIKIDGDDQFDEKDVFKLIDIASEKDLDFIKCDRFWSKGIVGDIPNIRYFGNAFASFLIKISTGNWRVNDPLNGLFLFSNDAVKKLKLPKLFFRYGYPFFITSEISNIAINNDLKIAQYKNTISYRNEESSISAFIIFFKLMYFVLKNFLRKITIKLKNSDLQISAILDIFSLIILFLSFFSIGRFFAIRYFDYGGPQGNWFIVFLIFIILYIVVLIYSQKIESDVKKQSFVEIN